MPQNGKLLAWQDLQQRPSKRQKDLLDVMRLIEAHHELESLLPKDVADRLKQS